MLLAAGTVLEGKYRVDRLLGAGGMGSVWIGEHTLLARPVAVKVLDRSATNKDASAIQRFLREAQTAARLRSDHIVDVLDVGSFPDGTPFLIMELLEGETLSARIKRVGRLPQAEAALLCDQLLDGLAAAHVAGVIHRDIKPDNCFVVQKNGRDHLKLLDFGISKVAGDPREMRMTKTGVVMGTPYYMAPEQARGAKEIDHRCDLYAAGAILYECVTGRVPFEAESVNELLFKIVLEPLVPPRSIAPEIDSAFEQIVLRAMGREADQRYQTAQEFRAALAAYLQRGPGSGTVIERIVVSTPAPGAIVRGQTPVSGIDATAPIDSDAIRAATSQPPRGSRPTPSGLQGLSATGPLHVSSPPPRGRSMGLVAAGALAVLAIVGGVVYVATNKTNGGEVAGPAAAAGSSSGIEPAKKTDVVPLDKPSSAPTEPAVAPPSPTASSTASAKKGAPLVVVGKKIAPTSTVTVPPVPPPTPGTAPPAITTTTPPKGGAPRPIDTTL